MRIGGMDQLIVSINTLQSFKDEYKGSEIQIPQVIVIGSQSSGKSSILERITGCDILPKGDKIATRCPIILQLIHEDDQAIPTAIFVDKDNLPVIGENDIRARLKQLTNEIENKSQKIRDSPIILKLYGSNFPTLTLIDLPGIIKNDGELPSGSVDIIKQITDNYTQSPLSIILAISAANVDLANSDAIEVSRKFDPSGQRTLHVITKIDLMDQGTDARDILRSNFVKGSLGTVFLVNRNQHNVRKHQSMKIAEQHETEYLEKNYGDLADKHGLPVLVTFLVKKLNVEIRKSLPNIMNELSTRKDALKARIDKFDMSNNISVILMKIMQFIESYENCIRGKGSNNCKELQGGARISFLLFDVFERNLDEFKVHSMSDKEIKTLMKNTTGSKKFSYSIESAYENLTQNEIVKFKQPCLNLVGEVKFLLKEFVNEIIVQMNISDHTSLMEWLDNKMQKLIDNRYKKAKKICEKLLKCEIDYVFCKHPNRQSLTTDKRLDKTRTIEDENNNVMSLTEKTFSFFGFFLQMSPLNLYGIITGLLIFMKTHFFKIIEYFCHKKVETPSDDKVDIRVIVKMVNDYFEMVRQNLIYNVPKWIHSFMINDLIRSMKETLIQISEGDKTILLTVFSDKELEFERLKEEMKKLEIVENTLQDCLARIR